LNSVERVSNRLAGLPVDRIPNLNILMQFAARYIGIPYGKYCTDYRCLVEGNIRCCRDFGIDMVSAISDPFRETSGFGGKVVINLDDVPSCPEPLIKDYADLGRLRPVNPCASERMADRIKAISLYQETCGAEFPVLGWVEGPFAEAADLRGVGNLMFDIYDEPEFVRELLAVCLEQGVLFAKEQAAAGAAYIGIGDAAASLVSPQIYEEFVLPMEKILINEIHAKGAKVKLHICGNTSALLESMATTGADIIDIDYPVDLQAAMDTLSERALVCGNFDPVRILLRGTPETVRESVKKCVGIGKNRLIVSAGCEVPKFTPAENLKAVAEALLYPIA